MKPLRYCVLALWTLYLNYGLCSSPQAVTWSNKKFGPDGPWQAVIVDIGSNSSDFVIPSENNSRIALYPGGSWDSKILLTQICDNKTLSSVCYADKAGRFDGNVSVSFDNKTVSMLPFPGNGPCGDLSWGAADAIPVRANAKRARDWITIGGSSIPDVDLVSISGGWRTYPGGQAYPLEVGTLSLGAPDINQTFGAQIKINMTFVTSYLYERQDSKGIPSYSYGMHIGSASLGIPGSLHLGGYDRDRIIGDVSAQPFDGGNFPIQMNDIGIGVEEGGSPWSFASKTDLLAQGNSSLASGLKVRVDPTNPYLYLPQSACDAMAAQLPVTYKPDYGLYFWDTSDERYRKIVTSPSYLDFTFSKDGLNTANITIKVPFALLNLTLEAPLVRKPTQYFPCMATNSTPVLGRAFLQAAFIGVNWLGDGNWFLAQAPGPDSPFITNTVAINGNDSTIIGTSNSWGNTWKSIWDPLPLGNKNTDMNTTTPDKGSKATDKGGLSSISKIGIIVGSTVGGALTIALACWLYIRRRRQQNTGLSGAQEPFDAFPSVRQSRPVEISDMKRLKGYELSHDQQRYEMGLGKDFVYELGPAKGPVFELGHGQRLQCGPFELPERTSMRGSSNFI